jgi:PAS domain S-box-containing protein
MTLNLENIFTSIDNSSLILDAVKEQNYSVVITDANRKIIYLNNIFEKMTGFSISELLGQKPAMLQGEATTQESILHLKNNLNKQHAFEGDIINYRKNGETYLCRIAITPIYVKGTCTHYIAYGKDVTTYNNATAASQQLLFKIESFIENNLELSINEATIATYLKITTQELSRIIMENTTLDNTTFIKNCIAAAKIKQANDAAATIKSRQLIASIFEN